MIKKNELRIGNLVHVSVYSLDIPAEIENGDDIDRCERDGFKPISLTEEWFDKLGFIQEDRKLMFDLPQHIQDKCKGDKGFKRSAFFFNNREDLKVWMDCQTRVAVSYVHEVQNLVFALTGEELEVKL